MGYIPNSSSASVFLASSGCHASLSHSTQSKWVLPSDVLVNMTLMKGKTKTIICSICSFYHGRFQTSNMISTGFQYS